MLEKIGISPTKSKSEIERNIADFFDVTKCVHQIEILFIHMRMCYKIAKSTLEGKYILGQRSKPPFAGF